MKETNRKKEVKGKFRYDRDTLRSHCFKIETDEGVHGIVFVPNNRDCMPKRLILDYADKTEYPQPKKKKAYTNRTKHNQQRKRYKYWHLARSKH